MSVLLLELAIIRNEASILLLLLLQGSGRACPCKTFQTFPRTSPMFLLLANNSN